MRPTSRRVTVAIRLRYFVLTVCIPISCGHTKPGYTSETGMHLDSMRNSLSDAIRTCKSLDISSRRIPNCRNLQLSSFYAAGRLPACQTPTSCSIALQARLSQGYLAAGPSTDAGKQNLGPTVQHKLSQSHRRTPVAASASPLRSRHSRGFQHSLRAQPGVESAAGPCLQPQK